MTKKTTDRKLYEKEVKESVRKAQKQERKGTKGAKC